MNIPNFTARIVAMFWKTLACGHLGFLAALMLAASPAYADWAQVVATKRSTFYVDPDTLRKAGNFVRAWTLMDNKFRPVGGARSVLARREFDCSNSRYSFRGVTQYAEPMAAGTVIESTDKISEWFAVVPNTVGDRLLKFVCGK
jgi:hypothetical protein